MSIHDMTFISNLVTDLIHDYHMSSYLKMDIISLVISLLHCQIYFTNQWTWIIRYHIYSNTIGWILWHAIIACVHKINHSIKCQRICSSNPISASFPQTFSSQHFLPYFYQFAKDCDCHQNKLKLELVFQWGNHQQLPLRKSSHGLWSYSMKIQ